MPIYEYLCDDCQLTHEQLRPLRDESPPEPCPRCGGSVCRVMSASSFRFKGSGWYATDYKRSTAPKGNGGKSGEEKGKAA
jgi:putative FmdB family regulatory protein